MEKQKVLDVLNSLDIFETNGGEDAYILVKNNEENRKALNDVGVSTETINKYGDEETFCILALAYSEGYANTFVNGKLINRKEEVEIALPNGYTVQIFVYQGNVILGLVNGTGYFVSDTKLNQSEISNLKKMFTA